MDFEAQEAEDLSFKVGELITIVKPCELMFWYIGKNDKGETGMVPRNFLEPLSTDVTDDPPDSPNYLVPPALSPLPSQPPQPLLPSPSDSGGSYMSWQGGGGYLSMQTANAPSSLAPPLPAKSASQQQPKLDPVDLQVQLIQQKELRRRLPAGTLVMGISQFVGTQPGDLSFNVYEELMLLHPMEDPCWYYAQKTDKPEIRGVMPITHARLVYMSDDEDEEIYKTPTKPGHDRLYDDINEFISQSGWFSYPGLAHGKQALLHVLAKKMRLSYEVFMAVKNSIYKLVYHQGEKVYIGKAEVLHTEVMKHFECFDKKREEMREIDDELCHHTESSGWEISVWPLQPDQDLEAEWAKKIIENNSLSSREESGKLNETLPFSSMNAVDKFWEWFSPN